MEEERELTVTERIMLETDDIYTGSPSAEQEISDAQLHVEPWNRTTIADGLWLQENAIAPFSARDIMLANEIDKTNERVSELEENTTDGREVRSFSPRVWSGDDTSWHNIHNTRVIPDDEMIPKNSVMYMPMVYSSPTVGETSEGGVLSMNSKSKSFQLGIGETGLWWDFGDPNNTTTNVNGDYGSFKVDTKSGKMPMKIYSDYDKPKDDTVKVLTSAGLSTLSGDGRSIEIIDVGNTRVISGVNFPPDWVKTTNHKMENTTLGDSESYINGGGNTVASAEYSVLTMGGETYNPYTYFSHVIAHGAYDTETSSYISDSFAVLSGPQFKSRSMGGSFMSTGGGTFYPESYFTNSVYVGNGGSVYSGIDRSIVANQGGSLNQVYATVGIFESGSAKNIRYSFIHNGGGTVIDSDNVFGSLQGDHVERVDKVFWMGGGNTASGAGISYGLSLGSNNVFSGANTDYFINIGKYNTWHAAGSKYTTIAGESNRIAANHTLGIGNYMEIKGSQHMILGESTSSWPTNAMDIIAGYRNRNGNSYKVGIIGDDNDVWDANYVTIVGNENEICDKSYIGIWGNANSGHGGNSLIVGGHNKNTGYENILIGDGNDTDSYSHNDLVAGDANILWSTYNTVVAGDSNALKNGTDSMGVFGDSNSASKAQYGIIAGITNNVYKKYNMAIGVDNDIGEDYAIGIGRGHKPGREYQVCLGEYTVGLSDSLLEVGVGTSDGNRITVFRIDAAGNVYCTGKIYADSLESNSSWTDKMVHP